MNKLLLFVLVAVVACGELPDLIQFNLDEVAAMNKNRQKHRNTPDVKYNETMRVSAQEYAERVCSENNTDPNNTDITWGHSGWSRDLGENMYGYRSDYDNPPVAGWASNSWYSEEKNYDYATGGQRAGTTGTSGHFVQEIWAETTDVAFGVAHCLNGFYVVVGRYHPAGNYGNYTKQIHRLITDPEPDVEQPDPENPLKLKAEDCPCEHMYACNWWHYLNQLRKKYWLPELKYNLEIEKELISAAEKYSTGSMGFPSWNGQQIRVFYNYASSLESFGPNYFYKNILTCEEKYDFATGKCSGAPTNYFPEAVYDEVTDIAMAYYQKPSGATYILFGFWPKPTGNNVDHVRRPTPVI